MLDFGVISVFYSVMFDREWKEFCVRVVVSPGLAMFIQRLRVEIYRKSRCRVERVGCGKEKWIVVYMCVLVNKLNLKVYGVLQE